MIDLPANLAEELGELLWGPWTICLVLVSGLWLSAANDWLQLRPRRWGRAVMCSLKRRPDGRGSISPVQSALTSLAGTLGTGNIVGVATALTLGGAGSIFWMWLAAFLGMMVSYAETVLGIVYRRRDANGEWLGGPMLYITEGLGRRRLAGVWAFFCSIAAFGVGNLTQVNSMAHSAQSAWGVAPWITCTLTALLAAPAVLRGVHSVSRLAEKLIPIMTVIYLAACAAALAINFRQIPSAFSAIFTGIFTPSAAGGGILGAMMAGVRRGIFTNEAGLGSSVLVRSSSDTDHPCTQGMWAIFEVFADTMVMCTLTALVILTSGAMSVTGSDSQPLDGAALSAAAFEPLFGRFSGSFITAVLMLFAFATIVSWSCCGERAFGYLCGTRYSFVYKLAYVLLIIPGGLMKVRTAWAFSDILNALMLIPNTVAVLMLWRTVSQQTKDYIDRLKPTPDVIKGN